MKNSEYLELFKSAYCFTDQDRNASYENWIKQNVKNKTVIDLGAGSGILCYLAVKSGAKKVYALERRPEMIDRMKQILPPEVEYIQADLTQTELPDCDIYLHEWLTSELWSESRFLKNFYPEGSPELLVGKISDLIRVATEQGYIDRLYPNTVQISEIKGSSQTGMVQIDTENWTEHSKQFITDYYPDISDNLVYQNTVNHKRIEWQGNIADLTEYQPDNKNHYVGWQFGFDGEHILSNHSAVSHWGLQNPDNTDKTHNTYPTE